MTDKPKTAMERGHELEEELLALASENAALKGELDLARQQPNVAPEPDWNAVRNRRIGELSLPEHGDAYELWLREQVGAFKDREAIEFLLERLDQARGITAQAIAPSHPNHPNNRKIRSAMQAEAKNQADVDYLPELDDDDPQGPMQR